MLLVQRTSQVFKCPKWGKLTTPVQEGERQEEERNIAFIKLLYATHAKVERQPCGRIYVETIINGKPLQAMLDTGARADMIHMANELLHEVGFSYTEERGFMEAVNARSLLIGGVTRGVQIQIG